MGTHQLSPCKERCTKTKLKMRLCSVNLLAVTILASLPYISTLTLPSGDPAPGRSPGPPEVETFTTNQSDVSDASDVTTEYVDVTTEAELGACAFARVPSESETVVTVSETDSEVNLTVGHAVFETEELVRGVVYDAIARADQSMDDIFGTEIDDIFSSIIGPVFNMKTPHPISNNTQTLESVSFDMQALNSRLLNAQLNARTLNARALKRSTVRVPLPSHHELFKRTKVRDPPEMVPQTKLQFDMLLQQPIPTVPDFKEDVFGSTTRRFHEIETLRQQLEEQKMPNISRRQNPYRRPGAPPGRVRMYNQAILQKIIQAYNLTDTYISNDLLVLATQLYYRDRQALLRSLGLMAQFVYGAQYKFLYAQKLKVRYQPHVKYRLGYAFAVLENLKNQFYAGYYAMLLYGRSHVPMTFEEEVMYLLKIYERALRIRVEFNDITSFIRDLDWSQSALQRMRSETEGFKENIYETTKPSRTTAQMN